MDIENQMSRKKEDSKIQDHSDNDARFNWADMKLESNPQEPHKDSS